MHVRVTCKILYQSRIQTTTMLLVRRRDTEIACGAYQPMHVCGEGRLPRSDDGGVVDLWGWGQENGKGCCVKEDISGAVLYWQADLPSL